MHHTKNNARCLIRIALVTLALILLTRAITLSHNRKLHPDEDVFCESVFSLVNSILEPGTPFVESKEYPEGAYYFLFPFQLAGQIVRNILGIEGMSGTQYMGRLASVFYFAVSFLLGMRLIWKYLGKSKISLWIYGLIMSFSLFFIEQSRYGTGDIISLILLMLLINLTAQAVESEKPLKWWAAAFFVGGILGAVKYPQLVFSLIPLTAFLFQPGLRKGRCLALLLAVIVAGFFLFSPKAMLDPGYILRVVQRESNAYLSAGCSATAVVNHLLNICLYLLFYSDFPLLPLLVLLGFVWRFCYRIPFQKSVKTKSGTAVLFEYIIPGICVFFFVYNLFVSLQFFRTYTPLFGILTLYTAIAAEEISSRKWGKPVILVLVICMILRGIVFVWVLAADDKNQEKLSEMVSSAVDENWSETWYTGLFSFSVAEEPCVSVYDYRNINSLIENNGSYTIQPGQLIITGAQAFHYGHPDLLFIDEMHQNNALLWSSFKEANQDYFVGQLYPDSYYYLFGGRIRGSTLSQYEFPCHYIYYRSK